MGIRQIHIDGVLVKYDPKHKAYIVPAMGTGIKYHVHAMGDVYEGACCALGCLMYCNGYSVLSSHKVAKDVCLLCLLRDSDYSLSKLIESINIEELYGCLGFDDFVARNVLDWSDNFMDVNA